MSQPKKCGAPTQRNAKRISTSKGSWGWGPNKEAFQKKANGQGKLGWAPTKRISTRNSTSKRSWVPTKELR